MSVNTNRWNRLRYTLYAPFYDLIVRRLGRGRRRAIELLDVKPGERVLIDGCGGGREGVEGLTRNYFFTVFARYSRIRAWVSGALHISRASPSSSWA